MPLVGTKCCQGGTQSFAWCQDQARHGVCQFSPHLLKYMDRGAVERAEVGFSVTALLGCARQAVLKQRLDYYEDPATVTARYVGDAVHFYAHHLNQGERGYVGERRLHADIAVEDGDQTFFFRLSGKPDQVWSEREVVDLKTTRDIPDEPLGEHVAQVNFYAWMLAHGRDPKGIFLNQVITKGIVTYISPNRQKEVRYPVPIWPFAQTRHYIEVALERFLPLIRDGQYPEVLMPSFSWHRDKTVTVKRDWHCDVCPVRAACDEIATNERGVSPNEVGYWQQTEATTAVGGPSFDEDF